MRLLHSFRDRLRTRLRAWLGIDLREANGPYSPEFFRWCLDREEAAREALAHELAVTRNDLAQLTVRHFHVEHRLLYHEAHCPALIHSKRRLDADAAARANAAADTTPDTTPDRTA